MEIFFTYSVEIIWRESRQLVQGYF